MTLHSIFPIRWLLFLPLSVLLHFFIYGQSCCIFFLPLSFLFLHCFLQKSEKYIKFFGNQKKINGAVILLCLLAAPCSVYETIKVPAIKHITLSYANLPPELEGYTIAQITDTHTGLIFTKEWQEDVVQKIMNEKPDLIVHTGDIGDTKPQNIAESLAPLNKLSAPDGVYYVFGNHENYHTLRYWQEYFQENALNVLEDETVYIHDYLAISGAKAQARYTPHITRNFLTTVPQEYFHIYLHHHPASFREAAPFIDLQLSGHTHGGTVFFLAPLIKHFNAGFVSGLYDDAKLYVSNGTGIWSYTPFRLFVPGEITILHLTGKN